MDGAFSNLSPDFWSGSSTGALGCIIPLCKVLSDFILLLAHSALFINHAKLRSLSYLFCMKQPSFALPMLCNKSIYRAQWRPFHVHTDSKRHLLEQKVFRSSFPSFSTVAHLGLSLRQKYSIIAAQAMSESCSVQPTVTVRAFAAFLNYTYLGFSSVSQVHSIFQWFIFTKWKVSTAGGINRSWKYWMSWKDKAERHFSTSQKLTLNIPELLHKTSELDTNKHQCYNWRFCVIFCKILIFSVLYNCGKDLRVYTILHLIFTIWEDP